MDAVKHIDSRFMTDFIRYLMDTYGNDFYVFGEFWKADEASNENYLEHTDFEFDLVDVRLHQNLFDASNAYENYDLRQIFKDTLALDFPQSAVTFVDNHDTQRGQALESTVNEQFKPIAYTLILLGEEGLTCLFYGDYYGIEGEFAQESFKEVIDKLLDIRLELSYGEQRDSFDNPNCIGWTRTGADKPIAILISNHQEDNKWMEVGKEFANCTFSDYLGNSQNEVLINEDG